VYDAMYERGVEHPDQPSEIRVYVGHLTKLIKDDCGLSTPYYSRCMVALTEMDCVRQLKRGGGGSMSEWLVLRRPTRELFDGLVGEAQTGKVQVATATEQRLNDLNNRLYVVEKALGIT
jgi:hypothetical protein